MTLAAVRAAVCWPEPLAPNGISAVNLTTQGYRIGFVEQFTEASGTIDAVALRLLANGGTGAQLRVRVESVDATTGVPTGSLFATGSESTTFTNPAINTNLEWAIATPPTLTRGQMFAIVLDSVSGQTANISTNWVLTTVGAPSSNFPYRVFATPSWAKAAATPTWALKISGSWIYQPQFLPASAAAVSTLGTAGAQNERGMRFILPFGGRVSGCWVPFAATTGLFVVSLYNSTTDALLASYTTESVGIVASSNTAGIITFSTPVDLPAGFDGRVTIRPTTTTGPTTRQWTLADITYADVGPGGSAVQRTTRTNDNATTPGAWTDTNTGREMIGLVFSHLETGGGTNNRKVLTPGGLVAA